MNINIDTTKQEFATGRTYNGPQILEYRVISIEPTNDEIIENTFDLVIWMRDKSRNLGYELKFFYRDSLPTGERILAAYDEGGNKELTVTQEDTIDQGVQ